MKLKKYVFIHQALFRIHIENYFNFLAITYLFTWSQTFSMKKIYGLVIDELSKDKEFEKPHTDIERYENIEEFKFPQEFEDGGNNSLDDSNEKELNDSRVQAMFKRPRQNVLSIFILRQDYYELPKTTIRANGIIYHIFEPNKFRDVQNLYQDKGSMNITHNESKLVTSTCWNEKHQPTTIDVTKDKNTSRFRFGLNSLFIPNTNLF